jgi:hypothetical protein
MNFHDLRRTIANQYGGDRAIGSVACDRASLALRAQQTLYN